MRHPLRSIAARIRGRLRHRRLPRAPVIVGGCERSGTTLLLSILSAHPGIQAIPLETWAFCMGVISTGSGPHRIRMGRLFRCLGEGPPSPTARRWAEKTPANVFHFREIIEHFQGAVRLIHIVRDGRDVVTSRHPSRPDVFWMSPHRWVNAVSAGLELEDDPRLLTIRYEDLVEDFESTAAAICRHVDEPLPPEVKAWWNHADFRRSKHVRSGKINPIFSSSIRKFERPDFPFAERVEQMMSEPGARELLERLGYA